MNPLAVLVLTLTPGLQEPEGLVAGRVVDKQNKPLAAAKVVLVHRPIAAALSAPAVLREAVTNAQGMFRAKLPLGPTFSAWASWDKGATAIAEGVEAKSFVTLVEDPGVRPEKIRVTGADAWARFAPLSYQVAECTENLHFVKVTKRGDHLDLPPLPRMPYRPVEVLGKDGTVLWVDRPKTLADEAHRTLALPPLATVKVIVRSADRKPLAGAEVRRHIRNYWYTRSASVTFGSRFRCLWPVVGVTDQEGKLTLHVPLPAERHRQTLHLMARHHGHRAALAGWYGGKRYLDRAYVKDNDQDLDRLTFELQKAKTPVGRLQISDTRYSGPVSLRWRVSIAGGLGLPFHEEVLHATDGRFAYPEPPKDTALEHAWVFLPNVLRQQVAKELGSPPAAAFALTEPKSILQPDGGSEPFLPRTNRAIRVITPDGRPAERALVIAAAVRDDQPVLHQGLFARTNRLGRVLIPTISTDQFLMAVTPDGWIARRLPPGEDTKLISLNLQARPTIAGRVVDDNDKPVAGVYVANAQFKGGNWTLEPEENIQVLPTSVVENVLNLLGPVTTDRDGRFRFPLLPVDWEMRVGVVTGGWGTVSGTESDPFSSAPGDKREPVVLKYSADRR